MTGVPDVSVRRPPGVTCCTYTVPVAVIAANPKHGESRALRDVRKINPRRWLGLTSPGAADAREKVVVAPAKRPIEYRGQRRISRGCRRRARIAEHMTGADLAVEALGLR